MSLGRQQLNRSSMRNQFGRDYALFYESRQRGLEAEG